MTDYHKAVRPRGAARSRRGAAQRLVRAGQRLMGGAWSLLCGCLLNIAFLAACHNNPAPAKEVAVAGTDSSGIREETIAFPADSIDMRAFVVYNDSIKGRRPGILVLPEWWGMNDYPKTRARMLAKLGYVAMAVDVYGGGRVTEDPDTAGAWAMTLYRYPERAKARIDAAIGKLKSYDNVDTSKIGAIGYCFGGGLLLNTVRLGDDLKGIVSFHGSLLGTPARKGLLRTKILVCHGNADKFVTPVMVAEFKKQMDSIGADYTFIGYDSATHAFTNPASTATGIKHHIPIAYNGKADTASWQAMKDFFAGLFLK